MSLKPEAIVNTAAYTAVDKAEEEPKQCFKVNSDAVATIANVCQQLDCPLVQISSDYVFETFTQRRPISESRTPQPPRGIYARSKWEGEKRARSWKKTLCRKNLRSLLTS